MGGTSETGQTRWEPNLSRLAFLARLALHAPRSLALTGFFSILLGQPGPLREGRGLPDPLSLRIHDIPYEGILDEKASSY
mgnify:CR=1 FL=1